MAEKHEHIVPPAIYVVVLIALMLLLIVTIVAAFVDLDRTLHSEYWNMSVALLIALIKGVLIVLFFMHVKYSSRVTWAFAGAAFVWLGIMMSLSLTDYVTRGMPEPAPLKSPETPGARHERMPPPLGLAAPVRPEGAAGVVVMRPSAS